MGIYEAVTVSREKDDKKPASRNILRPIRFFGGELEEAFDLKEPTKKALNKLSMCPFLPPSLSGWAKIFALRALDGWSLVQKFWSRLKEKGNQIQVKLRRLSEGISTFLNT